MSFNIQTFTSKIDSNNGLYRPNRFFAYINPPSGLSSIGDDTISFMCESASLPGRSIATNDDKKYGSISKIARETLYDNLNLSFIITNSMKEKRFFDEWLDYINPTDTFNVRYYNRYISEIQVAAFDISYAGSGTSIPSIDAAIYKVKFEDAYPINVGDVALSWNDTNNIARLAVTFTYKKWTKIN